VGTSLEWLFFEKGFRELRSRRKKEEKRGILRKKEENIGMSEEIRFRAKLSSRGRVYIPKRVVESAELWLETRIRVRVYKGFRSVEFDARVRRKFIFTVPKSELAVLGAERSDVLDIQIKRLS